MFLLTAVYLLTAVVKFYVNCGSLVLKVSVNCGVSIIVLYVLVQFSVTVNNCGGIALIELTTAIVQYS